MELFCVNCGNEITKDKSAKRKFCSRSCSAVYSLPRHTGKVFKKTCKCGKKFESKTRNRVHCENCAIYIPVRKRKKRVPNKNAFNPWITSTGYFVDRRTTTGKYVKVRVREHPNARNGYIVEHRVLVEDKLGRILEAHEAVHHIDGNRKNNNLSNLQLLTHAAHTSLHACRHGVNMLLLKCPTCGILFERERGKSHVSKRTLSSSCSIECGHKFMWRLRKERSSKEVQKLLAENVVKEYKVFNKPLVT